MRDEHRLRVFQNRVLRRICGPRMGEITREWRKLHKEELNDLYSSSNIIQVNISRVRWVGHVACLDGRKTEYRVLEGDLMKEIT